MSEINNKSIFNNLSKGSYSIETNLSGNDLRNLIIKLLKEYNIKITDYKVYFRADYTSLNK